MNRLRFNRSVFFALTIVLLSALTSCKTVDVRPEYALANRTEDDFAKGKRLLEESYLKMGYDKLLDVETYSATSVYRWKMPWTLMPMNALPGNKNREIRFTFVPNTFDGRVEYLEGPRAGKTYGFQSWQGYIVKEAGAPAEMKNKGRFDWGLPTFHYLIEGPMRIRGADIVRYAGEEEFEGRLYDLVYATWGQDGPHREHDQWLVYINRETGMIDMGHLTINDFFLPMPPAMKGATARFVREKASNGTWLPTLVAIQLGEPKDFDRHVYTFDLKDYQFDEVSREELYPLPGLEPYGDSKPQ